MKDIFQQIDRLKAQIDNNRPINSSVRKMIREYYRIGLTYSSNALEGNTLTESETKIILEDGITIAGKPLRDHLEAVGHGKALEHAYKLAEKREVSEKDIKKIHKLFYQRIDPDKAGRYRKTEALITGSRYPLPLPEEIPEAMKQMTERMNSIRGHIHPVELSAKAHKDLVFIHPFVDGNGRVGRLLMNLILLQEGYGIAIIPPVLRSEYISSLEQAHTNDRPFINLIARSVKETLMDYVRMFERER